MPPDDQSAGATPVVEGATPSQTPPAKPVAVTPEPPKEPAKGSDDALGDGGKKALDAERAAKRAAEKERDALKVQVETLENATKSDSDKALSAARKEGEQAADTRWAAFIRSARVEAALTGAGATDAAVAAQAREFAALKVNGDSGDVEGLSEAVEAFKTAHPTQFGPSKTHGDFGQGPRGSTSPKPATMEDAIALHYRG